MKGIKVDLNSEITAKVEASVSKTIELMARHTGYCKDEMVNTALKRFIATHKDYLPPEHGGLPK